MDIPEFASLEAVPCQAVCHVPAQPSPPTSADEVFGSWEAKIGVFFFGDGCLKIRISAIYLQGKKEWNKWITLYGVREASSGLAGLDAGQPQGSIPPPSFPIDLTSP